MEVILQGKSNMLDEVNSLLDLMTKEKKCLYQKITNLELKLESNSHNTEKAEKIVQTESLCEAPVVPNAVRSADVLALVMKGREGLKEMDCRVEQVSTYCSQERASLRAEMARNQNLLTQSETNLRKQIRETKTLETKLEIALKTQKELKRFNDDLTRSAEEMRTKYMKARTTLLATRGRMSMHFRRINKTEDDKEKREIMKELEKEQQAKSKLQQRLQGKDKDIEKFRASIIAKEKELSELGEKYKELQLGVEERLDHLSKQLALSRDELERVEETLKSKQNQLDKSQLLLQDERKKSVHLLSQSCSTTTRLTSQLEKERKDHEEQLHSLSLKIAKLKTQHAVELERVKDVTGRRCRELAQEIWTLKKHDGFF